MSSSSTSQRERAAARAKLERQMAEKLEKAAQRKRRNAILGAAAALILVVGGVIWLVSSFKSDKTDASAQPTPAAQCVWNPKKAADDPMVKEVGAPPSGQESHEGTQVMTIDTNFGPVEVTMDLSKSPCTAASMSYLASKNFYDDTKCHRMFTGMLQCGDPNVKSTSKFDDNSGKGGPSYTFANENLPNKTDPTENYPAGTVAMANSGADTNGSQFFIIYDTVQLDGNYVIVGKVTAGLDNVKKATTAGHDGAFEPTEANPNMPGGGHPKSDIIIKSLKVGPVVK